MYQQMPPGCPPGIDPTVYNWFLVSNNIVYNYAFANSLYNIYNVYILHFIFLKFSPHHALIAHMLYSGFVYFS